MAKNIIKIVDISWVKAKDIDVPRNGAEHGVANKTANIPERKLLINMFLFFSFSVIFWFSPEAKLKLKFISKFPNKFEIKMVRIMDMVIKKYGFWNCNPQPNELPNSLNNAVSRANIKKVKIIPKIVAKYIFFTWESLRFLCFVIDINFIDKTGNTQGIIFRIKPPISAKIIIFKRYL